MSFKTKIDKQDKEMSQMVKERDKKCKFCDRSEGKLENSHFWGRGLKTTRFDARNCDLLCFTCHQRNESNKQGFYKDWKLEQLGEKEYESLRIRANQTFGKYGEFEKPRILKELKRQRAAGEHLENGWIGVPLPLPQELW